MKKILISSLLCICVAFGVVSLFNQIQEKHAPPHGAVVSAHPLATQAGLEILQKGGNAYDAAIAVSAMLSVAEPFGSGIGGGAFWLTYDSKTNEYAMLDARETAPSKATADMYLDDHGEVITGASTEGALAAGIPGLPASFVYVSEKYGNLPLIDVLKPAIHTANGFPVDERYINGVRHKYEMLLQNDDAADTFLDTDMIPEAGWILKQENLAKTLTHIGEKGFDGFYGGEFAQNMVDDVNQNGGIWSIDDLKNYKVLSRQPVITKYKDATIIAPVLPSSGGLVLANMFNILSGFDLEQYSSADQKHIIIESMRHAYHNRARYMGDTDFVDVPVNDIISTEAADIQRRKIDLSKALPSKMLDMSVPQPPKGTDTTHFSVIDKDGNRVAVTQSINFWFGSGFVPKGTGVLLNNQMDDFVVKPGVENGYGLIGTSANAIEGGKRMLSSMTPTFVENNKGMMIIGTPGGSRIISMNALGILAYLDGQTASEIVAIPRYHHQFMPDQITFEEGALSEEEQEELVEKGHVLNQSSRRYGNMQVVIWNYDMNKIETASDPRGHGAGRVY